MAREIHYEVFRRVGAKGSWSLHEIVSTRAIADYARRLRGGSILTIAGARHELLQEADIFREQLLAAFDAFVPGNDVSVYSD